MEKVEILSKELINYLYLSMKFIYSIKFLKLFKVVFVSQNDRVTIIMESNAPVFQIIFLASLILTYLVNSDRNRVDTVVI